MSIVLPSRLGGAVVATLADAFEREREVLVIRGADEETFCDGLDLSELEEDGSGHPAAALEVFAGLLVRLADGEVPSVCFVDGTARGGGVGILAACDVVVATPRARFALPEMLFGLVPAVIWPVLLRRVGEATVRRWARTAASFGADEALRLGLVDEVVEVADGPRRVAAHRRCLARPSAMAQERLATLCRRNRDHDLRAAIFEGAAETAATIAAADVREARRKFAEGEVPWRQ